MSKGDTESPILVQARKAGLTLSALADRMGLHVRTVENWTGRTRRPTPPQLTQLALALGCELDDLADDEAPVHQRPTNPQRRPWGATNQPVIDAAARFNAARARAEASGVE